MAVIYLNGNARSVSVEEWCELALTGEVMPIKIQLNGKSMEPLIRIRQDYVTVVPLRRDAVKGDIVVFKDRLNRYCAHRVKKVEAERILTIGDNCFDYDPWTPKSKITGIVIMIERNGKKYKLDSPLLRTYGRIRMALLPLRVFNHKAFIKLCSVYVKIFRKRGK